MLDKYYTTLKQSNSIRRIVKSNKKLFSSTHTIFFESHQETKVEVAFVAPKKLGNAVKRNLAKRRLRAIFRAGFNNIDLSNFNLVLMANANILKVDFKILMDEANLNLEKLKAINV